MLQAIPTGLLEASTFLHLLGQWVPLEPLPVIGLISLTGIIGYPAWVGGGLTQIHHASQAHYPPGEIPAFYLTGGLQYARLHTQHAPPALNYGVALEYVRPLAWGLSLRSGLHGSQRRVSAHQKTCMCYSDEVEKNRLRLVDVHINMFELYGPIELMARQSFSSELTFYGTIGYYFFFCIGHDSKVHFFEREPETDRIDYEFSHDYFGVAVGGSYLLSCGVMTNNTFWEIQYTNDIFYHLRLVRSVQVKDPVFSVRLRIGYRLPLH